MADWIKQKKTDHEIREELIRTYGIPGTDTDEIIRLARSRVKDGYREYGGKIAASGCLVTLGSGVLFVLSGGLFFAYGAAAIGIAMLVGGILMRITGLNLAGKEAN